MKPLFLSLSLLICATSWSADHSGGTQDTRGKSLSLTDLYVFKEGDQTGTVQDNSNLIFILNTHPRANPQQQFHFSSGARYEFHVSRVADNSKGQTPTGSDDVIVRFQFGGANTSTDRQPITVTVIKDNETLIASQTAAGGTPETTSLADLRTGASNLNLNTLSLGGFNLTVFAGLRQDPFFADLEQIFRFRGHLTGVSTGAIAGATNTAGGDPFKPIAQAVDDVKGYNVNSIVARIPIAFLQNNPNQTTFDVWATVTVPN